MVSYSYYLFIYGWTNAAVGVAVISWPSPFEIARLLICIVIYAVILLTVWDIVILYCKVIYDDLVLLN